MNWDILLPIIIGIFCAILGYIFGKLSGSGGKSTDLSTVSMWRDKNAQLEADLAACKSKLSSGGMGNGKVASSFANTSTRVTPGNAEKSTNLHFDAGKAKTAFGKTIKIDDLKVVEGIGPKIAALFNDDGITTWEKLGETPVVHLQKILDAQGERYKVHNPETWPMQANMAYQGRWTELKKWQDEHDYGKK